MKKYGILLPGTLKLGKKLNKFFVDFEGLNVIFVSNPKSYKISKPTDGFEYYNRVLLRLPYVVRFFSESDEVKEKSLKLFKDSTDLVKQYKMRGVILNLGHEENIYNVKEMVHLLNDLADGASIYIENTYKGVCSDVDLIKEFSDNRVIINLANAWAAGYDFDDKTFIDNIRDDIVKMNGNKYSRGLYKAKICDIDNKENKYYDKKDYLLEELKGYKLFYGKSIDDLYNL